MLNDLKYVNVKKQDLITAVVFSKDKERRPSNVYLYTITGRTVSMHSYIHTLSLAIEYAYPHMHENACARAAQQEQTTSMIVWLLYGVVRGRGPSRSQPPLD